MFDKLSHGIPLAEASAFFIKLRDFSKTADGYAPPDETGTLEGQFAAPVEQVLAQLGKMVQNELKTNYAYMAYANSLRDLSHHAIAEEFENHAHDETDHADWLLRRMGVLGGPINLPDIPAPPASTDPHDIVQTMIRMEQEGIENWRILRNMVGDENPMKFKIEEYLTAEQEHLDELWQLVPHEANPAVLMQAKGNVMQTSEQPQVPPSAPDTSPAPPDGLGKTAFAPKSRKPFGALSDGDGYEQNNKKSTLGGRASSSVGQKVQGLLSGFDSLVKKTAAPSVWTGSHTAGLVGSLAGGGLGLAHGLRKDEQGQRHVGRGIAEGVAGSLAGSHLGAAAHGLGTRMQGGQGFVQAAKEHGTEFYKKPFQAFRKLSADLTTAGREQIAKKNFALSAKQSDTGKPAYPIHDKAHATNALARVKQHGSPAEKSEVYKDVARKFPELASKSSVPALKAKEKSSEMSLPPTAMGQQSAPPQPTPLMGAAAGQHAKMAAKEDSEQVEAGRSRAIANLSSGFTSDANTRGERVGDLIGRVVGATGGGLGGHHLMKGKGPALELAGTLGGAALGQHIAGKAGKMVGQEVDARNFEQKFASALKKLAEDEGLPAQQGDGLPPAESEMDPTLMQYLQQEQAGMAAEKAQEEAFYKQRFQEASQQLQAAQGQLAQLQQQADASGQVNAQMMQQAQQIQQAAAQNAAAAHQAATQAMQQSLQAQNESIQQAQLAVGMRDAVHAMRQGLLQMVQQQLPPATPAETAAIQADQAAQMGMMGGGMDNTQQAPGAEGEVPGANQAGQPGAQPDAGTPPQSATPGTGNGPGTSPSAGQGAAPTMEGAQPQGEQGMQQQPAKTAMTQSSHDRLIGAIMGGVAGGVGTAAESQMSNEPLRQKVKKLEAADKSGGGFVNALNLAQARSRLAMGEFTEKHPVAASAIGAGLGAMTGASMGPSVRTIMGG